MTRLTDITVPELGFPFSRHNYVEKDSDAEIHDCVEVLLRTEIGEREEVPDYGVPDPTFREGGMDLEGTMAIVAEWEPRAEITLTRTSLEGLVDRVRVGLIEKDQNGD